MQGGSALALCLCFALPSALGGWWSESLQVTVGILGSFAMVAAWGSRGSVTISPAGIRVAYGHVRIFGWELGIDQVASVEVADVRLLRSAAAWQCLTNLALRDGPALVVRTRGGGRRVVTVPDAEAAAAALRGWLDEHGRRD